MRKRLWAGIAVAIAAAVVLVLTPLLLFAPRPPSTVLYKSVAATEHFPSGTCD